MMGRQERDHGQLFYEFSLDEMIPMDRLLRRINVFATAVFCTKSCMTYLNVRLRAGERWIYQPPKNHSVAWIASHQGTVLTPSEVSAGEAVVFEEGEKHIEFEADTGLVRRCASPGRKQHRGHCPPPAQPVPTRQSSSRRTSEKG
jgi:hypothetical protein